MSFQPNEGGFVDPQVTAQFLSCQEHVLDVQAWARGESVLARVTVTQEAQITELDLLNACLSQIGPRLTPKAIWLDRRARPAA